MTADLQPATVMGDADRLFEAIVNVVANAISYNVPEGRVAVTLEHQRDRVELAVEDTGVGIAAKDLPLVFDPFFRADQARSRDAGGAGVGLAVTRAIIQRHGGTIAGTSEPGKGTRMVIQLPAVR
jgi:signal transduction histidine kinase